MTKKITTEEFIDELKRIWGDKYDYSKVNYVNAKTKVCIVCPEHGEFWTLPNTIRKSGCRKCFNDNRKTTKNKFIEQACNVHSYKYDYSKVNYIDIRSKVCIICPEHGEFWQAPYSHLNGNGCPKCANETTRSKNRKNKDSFLLRAKETHGNKYDYSKVEYVDTKTKVCIICPEHGEFWQTPESHVIGQGCPKCGDKTAAFKRMLTNDEWIKKAKEIHGDKYDYSRVKYSGYYGKICIICPIHGEFWQRAYDHLHGKGCKECKMSHLENRINRLLKENNIDFEYNVKLDFLKENNGRRSLDFYLPKQKIAIECQGIQHFTDSKYFKKTYKEAYEQDLKKYNDCKRNGIKVLYFSNYITDNYIDKVYNYENEILNEILKNG